jgi:hypothetical protein
MARMSRRSLHSGRTEDVLSYVSRDTALHLRGYPPAPDLATKHYVDSVEQGGDQI